MKGVLEDMVYLFLADGHEEIEALTPVDLLRRAGIEIATVSLNDTKTVTGAHNIKIEADLLMSDVDYDNADMLILPGGGPGTKALAANDELMGHVKDFVAAGRNVAAICAAPALTLGANGLLNGRNATCFPGMEEHLIGANHCLDEAVIDGNIITSRGLGTAIPFALAIIAKLTDQETADKIGNMVVYRQ